MSPGDRTYLGMQWDCQVFIDGVLPFGLWSAPLIFTATANAFQSAVFHYIDDFITVGEPDSEEGAENIASIVRTLKELGLCAAYVPIEDKKTEGPTTYPRMML